MEDGESGLTDVAFRERLRHSLRREPVMLAGLAGLALIFFLAVTGLSRLYHAQQDSLATRWFSRGSADLKAQHYDRAVVEFRAALAYSRDDYSYQLNLAEALLGQKRTTEARAYLINLWDREPEDGLVNLELARIAAQQGNTEQSLRYYHNAIYATWAGEKPDQEAARRDTRLELADYLLKVNATEQAQAELIALAASLGSDAAGRAQAADLLMRAQDYEHALEQYRESLKTKRRYPPALAGAGAAAFALGRYDVAEPYLKAAVAANANDSESEAKLKSVELVLQMDPFQRQLSAAERDRRVMAAFKIAGERAEACPASDATAAWDKLKPQVNAMGLKRNRDLANQAMEVVFAVERASGCGTASAEDAALGLIGKAREGN